MTLIGTYDESATLYKLNFSTLYANETKNLYDITWGPDMNENCRFHINGLMYDEGHNTILHNTTVESGEIGRFCDCSGDIYDYPRGVGITDCIATIRAATSLTPKLLGIITGEERFASHGDVLVRVDTTDDDGASIAYELGDLLVPTFTGARKATNDEKMFIALNGLPRVRVVSTELVKINNSDTVEANCLPCFMS
jgi:hypothetical protein